eukprot:COSAG06_NODE_22586_length_718_cov_34.849758_1_plen_119_part_00
MRGQGGFTTAQSDFNAARGDSESPARAVWGAELARRGRVLGERGKVGKGAERKVKNHFIDHSYHFIPNAFYRRPGRDRPPAAGAAGVNAPVAANHWADLAPAAQPHRPSAVGPPPRIR